MQQKRTKGVEGFSSNQESGFRCILRKKRFPSNRHSNLNPRGDGPFQVLEGINDNAYKIVFLVSKMLVQPSMCPIFLLLI